MFYLLVVLLASHHTVVSLAAESCITRYVAHSRFQKLFNELYIFFPQFMTTVMKPTFCDTNPAFKRKIYF